MDGWLSEWWWRFSVLEVGWPKGTERMFMMMITMMTSGGYFHSKSRVAKQRKAEWFHKRQGRETRWCVSGRSRKIHIYPFSGLGLAWLCMDGDLELSQLQYCQHFNRNGVSIFRPLLRVSPIIKTIIIRMHHAPTNSSGPFLLGQRTRTSPENAEMPILL